MPEPPTITWQAADKVYQLHHITCPQCIAAGAAPGKQERCPQGQALWQTYNAAGDPTHFTWLNKGMKKP